MLMSKLSWPRRASTKWLIFFWVLALVAVVCIYFNVGPDRQNTGGGGIIWLLPALVFSIIALALAIMRMIRR
jgi:hypothetical protein